MKTYEFLLDIEGGGVGLLRVFVFNVTLGNQAHESNENPAHTLQYLIGRSQKCRTDAR